MTEDELDFFSTAEEHELHHEHIDCVIDEVLNNTDKEDWPETIEIWGWKQAQFNRAAHVRGWTEQVVQLLVDEWHDTEYANPEEEHTVQNDVWELAEAFVTKFLAGVHVWHCNHVHTQTINVQEWLTTAFGKDFLDQRLLDGER